MKSLVYTLLIGKPTGYVSAALPIESTDKSTFITGTIIPVDGGLRLVSQEQIAKIFIK